MDSVERVMEKSDKSTALPTDAWLRTQSALPSPGFCLLKAAGMLLVKSNMCLNVSYMNKLFAAVFAKSYLPSLPFHRVPSEAGICAAGKTVDHSW